VPPSTAESLDPRVLALPLACSGESDEVAPSTDEDVRYDWVTGRTR
jgi:hypothetical protein